ncbi:hypothetical protein DID76_03935 [Candidatus Marinamargulisbacteria bacterium SCGC AG-414-C22]|nr:hypothetical protein DID76_03935 [Candidatus Marinamargulisbacteria bacterium SCGC AG-414-C22]
MISNLEKEPNKAENKIMFTKKIKNWAKTTACSPAAYLFPDTESAIQTIVTDCFNKNVPVKVCGKRHSYNSIFHNANNGILINLKKFNAIEKIANNNVTFQAGASTPQLLYKLKKHGLTIPNLGTNIMDNFIGACSNGYHGSGINYGIQSNMIEECDIIIGTGKKLTIKKDDELFKALGVNIGALGIIIRVTITCEPLTQLELTTTPITFQDINTYIKQTLPTNKHVKFVWTPHSTQVQLWQANSTTKPSSSWLSALKAYVIDGIIINTIFHALLLYVAYFFKQITPWVNVTIGHFLMSKPGQLIFPSYWIYFLPHALKQDTIEFAFDRKHTTAFLHDLAELIIQQNIYVQTPIEVRFVKQDSFWLSPAYEKDVCYVGTKIHFLPGLPRPEYKTYFKAFNTLVEKYNGKPHWGKQLYMSRTYLEKTYEKWFEFWHVADLLDPKKIFNNTFLSKIRPVSTNTISLPNKLIEELKKHQCYPHET